MRIAFLAVICTLCISATIVAQNSKTLSQIPSAEPFKIAPGSSFSASIPNETTKFNSLSDTDVSLGGAKVVEDFEAAMEIISNHYVGAKRLNYSELSKSSITGMLRSLDPHSNFFDSKEYRDLLNDENSEYIGIGASIANYVRNGIVETYVTAAYPDSPAYRAGLRFGDKIISVSGEEMSGKDSYYVRERIRGIKGTTARLSLERANTGKIEIIDIKRGVVPQPSIPDAYLLRPGVGYIDLTTGFTYTTAAELEVALKDLHEQGMNSLILDLRDNPGGILEQAVKVAEKFLPAGQVIVSQRGRTALDNRVWKSNSKNPETATLVVLVNSGSASASEIVSGALQDYDRALIVGEKTFGKGLVQSVINLPLGAGLTLTTARYYTPSGRSIQRDYSSSGLYDYYQHKTVSTSRLNISNPSKTITGRNVYSGDGIAPDEFVKPELFSQNQFALLDPIFFFAVELANGRISGLETSKITLPAKFGHRVRSEDFPSGVEMFSAFKKFVKMRYKISEQEINAQQAFITLRIKYDLAVAAFGSVAANQVLIENDLQVARAFAALPNAKNLAFAASKTTFRK